MDLAVVIAFGAVVVIGVILRSVEIWISSKRLKPRPKPTYFKRLQFQQLERRLVPGDVLGTGAVAAASSYYAQSAYYRDEFPGLESQFGGSEEEYNPANAADGRDEDFQLKPRKPTIVSRNSQGKCYLYGDLGTSSGGLEFLDQSSPQGLSPPLGGGSLELPALSSKELSEMLGVKVMFLEDFPTETPHFEAPEAPTNSALAGQYSVSSAAPVPTGDPTLPTDDAATGGVFAPAALGGAAMAPVPVDHAAAPVPHAVDHAAPLVPQLEHASASDLSSSTFSLSPSSGGGMMMMMGSPEITVTQNGGDVADNTGSVGFGSVPINTSVQKTFQISNVGSGPLMLGSVTASSGFAASNPQTSMLPPGQSTTFTVTFMPMTAGSYSGQISFSTNDTDENPFNFTVTGQAVLPTVSIAATDGSATEGDPSNPAADMAEFVVSRANANLNVALTVPFQIDTSGISNPASGADFFLNPAGSVTIGVGQTSANITLTANRDNLVEGAESLRIQITANPAAYTLGTSTATATIADDPAIITVEASDPTATEGASPADPGKFTARRSGGDISQALTVLTSVTGTAQPGSDYTAALTPVEFLANETEKLLDVSPTDNLIPEPSETVVLTLLASTSNPQTYMVGQSQSSATVTIDDNDEVPTISISGDTIEEGEDSPLTVAEFIVTLSHATGLDVSVAYATIDGSATAGLDYAERIGTLVILAGQTEGVILVEVYDDLLVEPTENFLVQLQNPVNATLQDDEAEGIIQDNEPRITKLEFLQREGVLYGELRKGGNPAAFEGGDQLFVGANDPNETFEIGGQTMLRGRNVVRVVAEVENANTGDFVWFEAYDVDDPSESSVIDPNDHDDEELVERGGDNRGTLLGLYNSGLPTSPEGTDGFDGILVPIVPDPQNPEAEKIDTAAYGVRVKAPVRAGPGNTLIAEVNLSASFAPGDNFRVLATFSQEELPTIEPPTSGAVPEFEGAATPQLSVWRKLHIERDSMGEPDENDGPFDGAGVGNDDVAPGNVGDPSIALLQSNFLAAYVETVDDLAEEGGVDTRDDATFKHKYRELNNFPMSV